jgi:hypothetical protein
VARVGESGSGRGKRRGLREEEQPGVRRRGKRERGVWRLWPQLKRVEVVRAVELWRTRCPAKMERLR